MAKSNVTTVQVPGDSAPQAAGKAADAGNAASQGQQGAGDPGVEDIDALKAELAAARAALAKKGATAEGKAANATDYANMRAADVDHTKLTKAVLTLDGWVCPPTVGVAPKQPQ